MARNPDNMQPPRRYYLLNYVFLAGLLLLLVNDHVWKWQYSNWLTGKLSDFVGLFIFPLFLSFLFPRWARWMALCSGLFFIFWKSPYSESFIEVYNRFALIGITRTVDYSDLLALSVLPVSYWLLLNLHSLEVLTIRTKVSLYLILVPTLFVFMATSPPPRFYYTRSTGNVYISNSLSTEMSREEILRKLEVNGINAHLDTAMYNNSYARPSYQPDGFPYFIIDELILEQDTIRDVQFAIRHLSENKNRVYLNGLRIGQDLEAHEVDKKLRRYYRKLITRYMRRELKE